MRVLLDLQFLLNIPEVTLELLCVDNNYLDFLKKDICNKSLNFCIYEADLDILSHRYPNLNIKEFLERSSVTIISRCDLTREKSNLVGLKPPLLVDLAIARLEAIDIIVTIDPDAYFKNKEKHCDDLGRMLGFVHSLRIWSLNGLLMRNAYSHLLYNHGLTVPRPKTPRNIKECVKQIEDWAHSRQSRVVVSGNVVNLSQTDIDPNYRQILSEADLITPAGQLLVYGMQKYGIHNQERISDVDLLEKLCVLGNSQDMKFYFVLGKFCEPWNGLRESLEQKLKNYPNLLCEIGYMSKDADGEEIIQQINGKIDRKSDIVIVARHPSYQEKWMLDNRRFIQAPIIGVGHSLEIFAGRYRGSPTFIQDLCLDWLFRSCQQPKTRHSYLKTAKSTIPQLSKLAFKHNNIVLDDNASVLTLWSML